LLRAERRSHQRNREAGRRRSELAKHHGQLPNQSKLIHTMFSSRVPEELASNRLSQLRQRLDREEVAVFDLTQSNPTRIAEAYPEDVLLPLSDPRGRQYAPDAFGSMAAREAVAGIYVRQRTPVPARRIILTASTSEAYALLFKLLCDPGDAVLVPRPSYPLFDLLTRLEAVEVQPYRLEYHGVWSIDRASVEAAITSRTRALLVVSPNNPTGSMLRDADREWLCELCAAKGLAIVSDEVFSDYPLAPRPDAVSLAAEPRALTFVLGGLSKSAGLPQVKLGWIAVSGPDAPVEDALARLEVICDTYLSVSTPVQLALPDLLKAGASVRAIIQARLRRNLACLRARLAVYPGLSLLEPEGGWSAVLQVPAIQSEEALVLRILGDAHVLVHPGYFFDFDREAYLVVSLLPDPEPFAAASLGQVHRAVTKTPPRTVRDQIRETSLRDICPART
jgi:aspartate/methionine/tyrosine aminotransferase